ncbi:MAG: O-methyltransferase [Chitinophagaceae bacterium]
MTFEIRFALKYIQYYLQADTSHAVHSPFVFLFIQEVLHDRRTFYAFTAIERRRKSLLSDNHLINITDMGAGTSLQKVTERRIGDIAHTAAKSPKYGKLLFRLVNYFQPSTILELGTSLGISAAYMASGISTSSIVTLEGSEAIANIASETFQQLNLKNIQIIKGNFEDTLASVLLQIPKLDMAFIDGNHRKDPTLRYFSQCLTQIHENSLIVFDDIHWTKDMEEAWEAIKANPAVTLTIDLFFLGVVFFKKDFKEKQHFVLRY